MRNHREQHGGILAAWRARLAVPGGARRHERAAAPGHVVCLATNAWYERHVMQVAIAGGWPLAWQADERCAGALVLAASVHDEAAAREAGAWGTVLMEHGAGLHYTDDSLPVDSAWRAGRGTGEGRALFLSPGADLAAAHEAAHPGVPVRVVGAPALDVRGEVWRKPERPIIAVANHWDCRALPETRSAWPWIKDAYAALAQDDRWEVWGHWHPFEGRNGKARAKRAFFEEHGIRCEPSFSRVLNKASVFVSGNSSALYEFAARGRPVVCVSPPWYRRAVTHGLRFWSHLPGVHCADAAALADCVAEALRDKTALRRQRARAVRAVFGELDGKAAARAAEAIRARFAELVNAGGAE